MRRAFVERWERRDVGTPKVEGNDPRLVALSAKETELEDGAEGFFFLPGGGAYVTREESQLTLLFARGESTRGAGLHLLNHVMQIRWIDGPIQGARGEHHTAYAFCG